MRIAVKLKYGGVDDDYRLITQAEFGMRANGHTVKEIRCSLSDYGLMKQMQSNARERLGRYDVPWVKKMLDEPDGDAAFGAKVVMSGRIKPGTVIVVGE